MASDGSPITISFTGKKGVNALSGPFSVKTDQPVDQGGEGTAPAPFDYLLYSIGTCAGFYVRAFMQSRNLPEDRVSITQNTEWRPDETLAAVRLTINLPADFPQKYVKALIRAAETCSVKKLLAGNLEISVEVSLA